jgi:pseudaminic acid biosynthesis-associated methylase
MMAHPSDYWVANTAYAERQTLTLHAREHWLRRVLLNNILILRDAIEFGANVGDNLRAIRAIYPRCVVTGVEPNVAAAKKMAEVGAAYVGDIHQFGKYRGSERFDLAFTRGVLIHIPPEALPETYDVIHQASKRWILIAEYYSPRREEIPYRGQLGLLWKGDFAGEMLDRHPDLRLVDYGFVYHRDPHFPQDDLTWFLMEKKQ